MVTCDAESKWYSRRHNVVVYWMSILLCIHNECKTNLLPSDNFALNGILLREMLEISGAFLIITARNYDY
jgi:hypothetical protein